MPLSGTQGEKMKWHSTWKTSPAFRPAKSETFSDKRITRSNGMPGWKESIEQDVENYQTALRQDNGSTAILS
jgi:hypothetical protein